VGRVDLLVEPGRGRERGMKQWEGGANEELKKEVEQMETK
jgi:hypothetical protein